MELNIKINIDLDDFIAPVDEDEETYYLLNDDIKEIIKDKIVKNIVETLTQQVRYNNSDYCRNNVFTETVNNFFKENKEELINRVVEVVAKKLVFTKKVKDLKKEL